MTLHTKPARRTTDRIEDMVAWILVAAGLLVVLLSVTVGVRVHDQLVERGRVESAMRTPATARLLSGSTVIDAGNAGSSTVMVRATWQDRSGSPRTGIVAAPRGLHIDSTMAIWIDASGAQVPAPTSAQAAELSGVIAGGVALGVGLGLLVGVWALVRRATLAANCARWQEEWHDVAPLWTRGEGPRG